MYNYIKPNTTVRTAAQVTAHAGHMINRTGALFNYAWSEDGSPPSYQDCEQEEYIDQGSCIIDEETEALNKKGRDDLNDLYINNQKFRDEVLIFVGNKTGLGNEQKN